MGTQTDTQALRAAYERMADMLEWPDDRLYAASTPVSSWSPAQHLQHVLLTSTRVLEIIEALEDGTAEMIESGPSLTARAILVTGWIPRGRASAPEVLVPDAIPSRAALRETCERSGASLLALAARAGRLQEVPGRVAHPVLGGFRAHQWLRFVRIHTDHHLAVIGDIDRRRSLPEALPDPAAPLSETP